MVEASAPSRARLGAVILAAGASSRMGQPKQLLLLGGRTLLQRTADACLEAALWPVVVVLGSQAADIRPTLARLPLLVVENPAWPEGMGSSVGPGLELLERFSRRLDGVVLAVCDQPGFSADALARLREAWVAEPGGVAAARYAGRLGTPAIFHRRHFAQLRALQGDQGARDLLRQPQVAACDLPGLARDLDTPEDYAHEISPPPGA